MQPDPIFGTDVPGLDRWGWMSPDELLWLNARASEMQSVVEIGCLHGRSSIALARDCPGTVYCIDPWSDEGYASWLAGVFAIYSNVVGIREESPGAGVHVPDPVEMVFIDGAHDYDSVKADIDYWLPRTTKLICGHDYVPLSGLAPGENPGFPDVRTVVDEIFGEFITVAPNTAIWYLDLSEQSTDPLL